MRGLKSLLGNIPLPRKIKLNETPACILSFIIKGIVPVLIMLLLHGLLPLYAVFLASAAFYPACDVLVDLMFNLRESLKTTESVFLALAALVAVLCLSAFYVPGLAFLVAYLPIFIVALVAFEFVVLYFKDLINIYELKKDRNYKKYLANKAILNKNGAIIISTVIAMTVLMLGSGLLVEANFVLAAASLALVVFLSVLYSMLEMIDLFQTDNQADDNDNYLLKFKKALAFKNNTDYTKSQKIIDIFLDNYNTAISISIAFGLVWLGFLPAAALTNPVFVFVLVSFIYSVYSLIVNSLIHNFNIKKFKKLLILVLIYIIASLVINPNVGFIAALSLGASSSVVWASIFSLFFLFNIQHQYKYNNFYSSFHFVFFVALYSSISSPIVWATIIIVHLLLETLTYEFIMEARSIDKLNAAIWFALSYSVVSYIMAPAGTLFVAMLGANVAIALPLAFVVYVAALKLSNTYCDKTAYITLGFFNTKNTYYQATIVLLSLLTLIVGIVLAFSGMFEIFAATNVMQAFVMQALTVATSVIVAATVWRTLDKALYNTDNEKDLNNKDQIDSTGKIALKALGVILFAGVGYFVAAILPMFAGLILPTWSALASAFSVLSVPGVFTAILSAAYATNIASFYLLHPSLLLEPYQNNIEEKRIYKTIDFNAFKNYLTKIESKHIIFMSNDNDFTIRYKNTEEKISSISYENSSISITSAKSNLSYLSELMDSECESFLSQQTQIKC